jgi:hypothetical protein
VAKNWLEPTFEMKKMRGWFFGNLVCFVLATGESPGAASINNRRPLSFNAAPGVRGYAAIDGG